MGKKRTRSAVTSKGERHSVSRSTIRLVRQGRSELEKAQYKLDAWRAGKNPWLTVPGPSSNMRFIRVRANSYWGDPRRTFNMSKGNTEG